MDRGTNRAQWEGEGGRGCEGRGGVEGGGPCCATCLVRTSILLRSDSPPPSLGPLGSRVRGRPLVLRGVAANLAWVGGALRTASREGRVTPSHAVHSVLEVLEVDILWPRWVYRPASKCVMRNPFGGGVPSSHPSLGGLFCFFFPLSFHPYLQQN